MTINTAHLWEKAAKSDNPYPILLLNRSEAEYFNETQDVFRWVVPVLTAARQRFGGSLTLLELGPGLYRFALALKNSGYLSEHDVLIAVDIIHEFLERAPKWVRCEDKVGAVPNESVHFIYTFCVFQHLTDRERQFYADQFYRVLRVGGFLLLQVPNRDSIYYLEKSTLHKFSREELGELFPSYRWQTRVILGNLEKYALLESPGDYYKEKRELFLVACKGAPVPDQLLNAGFERLTIRTCTSRVTNLKGGC